MHEIKLSRWLYSFIHVQCLIFGYLNASKFHIDHISDGDVTEAQAKDAIAIMRGNYETSLENFNNRDEEEDKGKK